MASSEASGYGKPPKSTRFKRGVSGNPSGRPKRVKSLEAELRDELSVMIRVRDGGREQEMSKARAVAQALVHAAVDGNLRAATTLLAFCAKGHGETEREDNSIATNDAAILNEYVARELRRRAGEDIAETPTSTKQESNHEK